MLVSKDIWLTKSAVFKKVYEEGKSLATKELVVFYFDTGEKTATKAGFSISKKVGKAVVRNKLKRRLKNILGTVADRLESGYALVFIGRPPATESSFPELQRIVYRLLRQTKMLKGYNEDTD